MRKAPQSAPTPHAPDDTINPVKGRVRWKKKCAILEHAQDIGDINLSIPSRACSLEMGPLLGERTDRVRFHPTPWPGFFVRPYHWQSLRRLFLLELVIRKVKAMDMDNS
ncbi:hypothetical protein PanWU01x14_334560 [Parasponia andersonii]|uniref:Uncharacterized protein n=1 Tax=Parasponia andersonii TaxID=3476 RepID=A0A2P5AGK2_PARAD|nr:hypothetical protein PanWU01x14_334560 [Parasponia andersonii]